MPDANNYRYSIEPLYSGSSNQIPSISSDTVLGLNDSQRLNSFASSTLTQNPTSNQYGTEYSRQQQNLQFPQAGNNPNYALPGGFRIPPDSSPLQMHNNFIKEL